MSASTKPYVVRQGDHLAQIAAARGLSPDDVWNLPDNADLKKLRRTYNVLLPGDILYLPADKRPFLPVKLGQKNVFVATLRTCTITHTFVVDGQPLSGATCHVLDVGGTPLVAPPPVTNAVGAVTFEVPVSTDRVQVVFDSGLTFVLAVGHLDPASSRSGCVQRLQHLGYLTTGHSNSPEWSGFALSAFQRDHSVKPTGVLDPATAEKLAEVYGA
ncbi:MAG: peptidoglycan-binding protein [Polyangiaceae bacterium]|nr:peptidoglycan-binding protein [Polyangiaceae bacterium]